MTARPTVTLCTTDSLTEALIGQSSRAIFMESRPAHISALRQRFPSLEPETFLTDFRPAWTRLKGKLLTFYASLGQTRTGDGWWMGPIASRVTSCLPSQRHIVLLLLLDKKLLKMDEPVLIICPELSLALAIRDTCRRRKLSVMWHGPSALSRYWQTSRLLFRRATSFMRYSQRWFSALRQYPKPELRTKTILIRSWFTNSTAAHGEPFKDRNFGDLPQHLKQAGHEVLITPMFYSMTTSPKEIVALLRSLDQPFLLPYQWCTWGDVCHLMATEVTRLFASFSGVTFEGMQVNRLLTADNVQSGLIAEAMGSQLINYAMRRIHRSGATFSLFLQAFENKTPEMIFNQRCRELYPDVPLIGYHHTIWIEDELANRFVPGDLPLPQLPEHVITAGPGFSAMLTKYGFPSERLADGAALRTSYIADLHPTPPPAGELVLFFPFPYDQNLALNLIAQLVAVAPQLPPLTLLVKPHPLSCVQDIQNALDEAPFESRIVYKTCADWYPEAHVVLGCGTCLTDFEALAAGKPLLRIVPQGDFFYDTMGELDYPLPPCQNTQELPKRLEAALALSADTLHTIATSMHDYFLPLNETTLAPFLPDYWHDRAPQSHQPSGATNLT